MQLEPKVIHIGSRQSDLAKLQAYLVGDALEKTGQKIQYHFRESLGDKNQNDPLWKMPEKGVFTQDFYQDLVSGRLDCVVHSWKDLPVEMPAETEIIATLPRADQRDLLLFKKSSVQKTAVQIYSSSPRREYNLKPFIKEYLPWGVDSVQFCNVRGNVQTRIRKMIEDSSVDGLIVAKAALDRLLSHPGADFSTTRQQIRNHLQSCHWMVLPLTQNPNAAAQGALAIEIRKDRTDLKDIFAKINCAVTEKLVHQERKIFSNYGGGCHQKLGVALLGRPYGNILMMQGLTPQNEILNRCELMDRAAFPPKGLIKKSFQFKTLRQKIHYDIPAQTQALWVARTQDDLHEKIKNYPGYIWTAGLQTWKKLAQLGIWVHGCAEGLGEQENPQIDILANIPSLNWAYLTHQNSADDIDKKRIISYHLDVQFTECNLDSKTLSEQKYFFFWKSVSQFQAVVKKIPEIKNQYHACGPGHTWKKISKLIPADRIYIYLNEADWLKETE